MEFLAILIIVLGAVILVMPYMGDLVRIDKVKTWVAAAIFITVGIGFIAGGIGLLSKEMNEPIPRDIYKIEVYEANPSNNEPLYKIWIEEDGGYYYILMDKNDIVRFKEQNCQIFISKRQMNELTTSKKLRRNYG